MVPHCTALGLLVSCMLLSGCIPTIEKSYKTPQTQGRLVYFNPTAKQPFTAVAGAKIFYQAYPDNAVYSDLQGAFELPATTKKEIKLLMVGHALTDYPIIIEQNELSDTVLATASLSMRTLEIVDLQTLIVAGAKQQPLLRSFTAADFDASTATAINSSSIHSKHHVDETPTWPCDFNLIQSLDRAIQTAQRLTAFFDQHTDQGTNQLAIAATLTRTHATQHYHQAQRLLETTKNSCQWPAISTVQQQESREKALNYFAVADQHINAIVQKTENSNSSMR